MCTARVDSFLNIFMWETGKSFDEIVNHEMNNPRGISPWLFSDRPNSTTPLSGPERNVNLTNLSKRAIVLSG